MLLSQDFDRSGGKNFFASYRTVRLGNDGDDRDFGIVYKRLQQRGNILGRAEEKSVDHGYMITDKGKTDDGRLKTDVEDRRFEFLIFLTFMWIMRVWQLGAFVI